MRILLFFTCFIWIGPCYSAEIYQCAHPISTWSDLPCPDATLLHALRAPSTIDQLDSCQKCKLLQRRKLQAKKVLREQKRQEMEQKQRLRLQLKCEKVTQQIESLNQRYRQGYTAKQRQVLDRKLVECQIKKQKFCH